MELDPEEIFFHSALSVPLKLLAVWSAGSLPLILLNSLSADFDALFLAFALYPILFLFFTLSWKIGMILSIPILGYLRKLRFVVIKAPQSSSAILASSAV